MCCNGKDFEKQVKEAKGMEEKRIKELFAQKLDEAEKTLENLKNQAASAKTADIKK